MTKGRNTSVVSIRLSDDVIKRLRAQARKNNESLSDYLKPILINQALSGSKVRDRDVDFLVTEPKEPPGMFTEPEDDKPPDLKKNPDYWKAAKPKPKEKYTGTARSAPCPCGSGKKYKRCCGI